MSGPSGVGKTTFLQELFSDSGESEGVLLIPRYTDRPIRSDEREGFEYHFTTHRGLLHKVFASDFIHFEKWGDYYQAIETRSIEDVLESDNDGIVLASVFGSARLAATYGIRIVPLYLWTGDRLSLMDPRCLDPDFPEVAELTWRINKKLGDDGFSEYEKDSLGDVSFIRKRMVDNFVDIAAANARLRSAETLHVIPDFHNQTATAIDRFQKVRRTSAHLSMRQSVRKGGGCFVLMPFSDRMLPVYEDHLVPVFKKLGISLARSDQIFFDWSCGR
nr:hypothetical protein [Amycolatopsis sp. WQ 127309]